MIAFSQQIRHHNLIKINSNTCNPFPLTYVINFPPRRETLPLNKLKLKYSSQAFPIRGLQVPYNHYGA